MYHIYLNNQVLHGQHNLSDSETFCMAKYTLTILISSPEYLQRNKKKPLLLHVESTFTVLVVKWNKYLKHSELVSMYNDYIYSSKTAGQRSYAVKRLDNRITELPRHMWNRVQMGEENYCYFWKCNSSLDNQFGCPCEMWDTQWTQNAFFISILGKTKILYLSFFPLWYGGTIYFWNFLLKEIRCERKIFLQHK